MDTTIFTIVVSCHMFTLARDAHVARYMRDKINYENQVTTEKPIFKRNRFVERILMLCPGFKTYDNPEYLLEIQNEAYGNIMANQEDTEET